MIFAKNRSAKLQDKVISVLSETQITCYWQFFEEMTGDLGTIKIWIFANHGDINVDT